MGCSSTEVLETDHFVGDRLDDLGAGDEHVRRLVDHDDEIGDGGRVNSTARTWTHDDGNLWDHTRSPNVSEENLGIGPERGDPFLNTSTARIVHANDRTTGLEGHIEDLANLQTVHFTQRATVDGEILSEGKDLSSVDGAVAGDHAVPGNDVLVHVKITAAMFDEGINLLEAAVVKEQLKTFTCRHFPTVVLGINTGLTTASLAASLAIS